MSQWRDQNHMLSADVRNPTKARQRFELHNRVYVTLLAENPSVDDRTPWSALSLELTRSLRVLDSAVVAAR